MTTPPLYAEDLLVGEALELGEHEVTLEEMLEFAGQWDPQGFHVDVAMAREGHFGEVIASGLHTLAVFQRLAVLGALRHWAVVAGRRIREIQFPAPVLAGTLRASLVVESVTWDRADRSLVVVVGRVRRADDTEVMTAVFESYVRNRPAAD